MNTKFYFFIFILFIVPCFISCQKDDESTDQEVNLNAGNDDNKQNDSLIEEQTNNSSDSDVNNDHSNSSTEEKDENLSDPSSEDSSNTDNDPYVKVSLLDLDNYLLDNQEEEIFIEVSKVVNSSVKELANILKKYSNLKIHLKIEKHVSLTIISYSFFDRINSLVSFIVPDGIENFGIVCCDNLTEVVISNSVKEFCLYKCPKITSLDIPESVTSIYIVTPDVISTYSNTIFAGCPSIKEITIHGKLYGRLGTLYFYDLKVFVPNDLVDFYKEQWKTFDQGSYTLANDLSRIIGY